MASILSVGGSSLTGTNAIGSHSPASTSLGLGLGSGGGGDNFTAFPAHYGNFGNSDKGFGTPGIQNGQLTILPQASSGINAATLGAAVLNGAANAAAPGTAGNPPGGGNPLGPLGGNPSAKTLGNADPSKNPPPNNPPPAQPYKNPFNGLTQTQQTADFLGLVSTRFRISAAVGSGNQAAVTQLTPKATALIGELQNQTFPGLGVTPPKPFATPEIPRIFLSATV